MIKFYKGDAAKYINRNSETNPNPNLTDDVIYFAKDSKEIFTAGKSFGKNADQSVTTEAITIEGGPLANDTVKEAFKQTDKDGKVTYEIPANTSVQDILNKLLCVEKWPTPSKTSTASLGTSLTAPTPSLSATSKSGTLVEVGDTITVGAMTAGATSATGTTTTTLGGFTYGYGTQESTVEGAEPEKTNNTIKTSITVNRSTPTAAGTHSLTVTVTSGFTGASVTQPSANATASSVKTSAFTGTAVLGENKISVSETGLSYTATVPAISPVYIYSNLGNTKGHMSEKVETANLSANAPTKTTSASLTGVYAIYSTGTLYDTFKTSANDTNAWNNQNDTYMKFSNKTTPQRLKLSDVTSGNSKFYGYVGFGADSPEENKIVLLPTGWKIDSVHIPDSTVAGKWITSSNQTATRIKGTGEAEAGFEFTNASGAKHTYTKWQIKGSTAANLFKLTISKS